MSVITDQAAAVLGTALGSRQGRTGQLKVGGLADVCVFDPMLHWQVTASNLRSQGKHTPFANYELPGRVRCTVVGGRVVHSV
jgi:dihydroorotase